MVVTAVGGRPEAGVVSGCGCAPEKFSGFQAGSAAAYKPAIYSSAPPSGVTAPPSRPPVKSGQWGRGSGLLAGVCLGFMGAYAASWGPLFPRSQEHEVTAPPTFLTPVGLGVKEVGERGAGDTGGGPSTCVLLGTEGP